MAEPPNICDTVFGVSILSGKGDLYTLYFARTVHFGSPLVLTDWFAEPMCGQTWPRVARRMYELADDHRARHGWTCVFVEHQSIWMHSMQYGVPSLWLPDQICSKAVWPQMCMAAAVRIRSGEVSAAPRVLRKREEYSGRYPFAALEFAGGERPPDDASVAGFIFGICLGLDESISQYVSENRAA